MACVIDRVELARRVAEIMLDGAAPCLAWLKKLLLVAVAICAVGVPVVLGQSQEAQHAKTSAMGDAKTQADPPTAGGPGAGMPQTDGQTPSGASGSQVAPGRPQFEVASVKPVVEDNDASAPI